MATKIEFSDHFVLRLKRLGRKYPAVFKELDALGDQLRQGLILGDQMGDIEYTVYKARLKNPSAGKGKSGGFRVIYYLRLEDHIILITIYAKTEQENISSAEIRQLIEDIFPPDDEASQSENGGTQG
jgi:mRNA-degrading endonuclease RelE of RelBE toxin-antitoxin system